MYFPIPDSSSFVPTFTVNPVSVILSIDVCPISGFVLSLYTFILDMSDLFPALSISLIDIIYFPSVSIFIFLSTSFTLVVSLIFLLVSTASTTSYSYPLKPLPFVFFFA